MKTKDHHGVTIRSEKYPLQEGDSFRLYSSQVSGTYRGYPHSAIPGRYQIVSVHGCDKGQLVIQRTDYDGADPFTCSARCVRAILTDEWSEYQKAR